mmetsp:Transcript_36292/g.96459  ORF Transcript_36292/g.96459 Transcript_36292/m.96459 type:complete len:160 (+) Transcript_36292:66-545(+)
MLCAQVELLFATLGRAPQRDERWCGKPPLYKTWCECSSSVRNKKRHCISVKRRCRSQMVFLERLLPSSKRVHGGLSALLQCGVGRCGLCSTCTSRAAPKTSTIGHTVEVQPLAQHPAHCLLVYKKVQVTVFCPVRLTALSYSTQSSVDSDGDRDTANTQ